MSRDVPHFLVHAIGGGVVDYAAAIWQRRNLVLAVLPASDAADTYAARLGASRAEVTALGAALVITRDAVPAMPAPSVLVADEWGDIVFRASAAHVDELPEPGELLAWLEHVEQRCPECEGEAR